MTTDLQARKFGFVFTWFDQNGDGWLTQDDFEKMAVMFTALADENDEKHRTAMKEAFVHWWGVLLEAGDGASGAKIGQQEFIRIMSSSVIAPENFERAVGRIADGMIGALDRDGNGSLSLGEFVRMYDVVGVPSATSAAWFKRLDRDSSGELSYAEFRQAIVEFYLSSDPNAPGNYLLGSTDALE